VKRLRVLTLGSLFAGVGGFDLAAEWCGIKTLWQVEIDPHALQVLAQRFPDAERFSDVREVSKANLKQVDIISGGFPCQDISNSGRRRGITGERSKLWFDMARIIGELKPRYAVIENVPALFTKGFETVVRDLAACGYDSEWQCLPASTFGAAHERDRIYLVAYPVRDGCALSTVFHRGPQTSSRWAADFGESRLDVWHADEVCPPASVRVADGVPFRLDAPERIRECGNAVCPPVAEYVFQCIIEHCERQRLQILNVQNLEAEAIRLVQLSFQKGRPMLKECGVALLKVRAALRLRHGEWGDWLATNFAERKHVWNHVNYCIRLANGKQRLNENKRARWQKFRQRFHLRQLFQAILAGDVEGAAKAADQIIRAASKYTLQPIAMVPRSKARAILRSRDAVGL
jgi:DNA (cytosine-5)-methyltransferase 1